jgi:3-isopropylmalate/(R)-2-methylmalate dehydratase small subunit
MLKGRAHKYGDNIDTDAIIPVSAMSAPTEELGRYCMQNIDPGFVERVQPGDFIVAGSNFGCGSSREAAPWAIKGAGIAAVIAESFARIFFRNSINIGLPLLQAPEAVRAAQEGDKLEADLASGVIRNLTRGESFTAARYPAFIQDLIAAGGLVPYTKKRLQEDRGQHKRKP